ncbi:hypothetical protein [Saccharothrix sp. HUAS TT1]|uniref:hypothetical protein n=1 Tax=unclassified Saccharothrix TaxID=2593673 RepID=UPI00345BF8AA
MTNERESAAAETARFGALVLGAELASAEDIPAGSRLAELSRRRRELEAAGVPNDEIRDAQVRAARRS